MELEIINSVILLRETRGFQAQCLLRLNEKIDCQKIEHRHQWMLRGKWWAHSKLIQFYRAIEKWSKYVQFSLIRFIFTPYSLANIIFVWRYFCFTLSKWLREYQLLPSSQHSQYSIKMWGRNQGILLPFNLSPAETHLVNFYLSPSSIVAPFYN